MFSKPKPENKMRQVTIVYDDYGESGFVRRHKVLYVNENDTAVKDGFLLFRENGVTVGINTKHVHKYTIKEFE